MLRPAHVWGEWSPNNYIDPLHELEDRLGYLKRMLRASKLALSSALDEGDRDEQPGASDLFELVEDELGRLAELAEELENKALAARTEKAVA